MAQLGNAMILGGALLIVPVLATRAFVGATWLEVAIAIPLYWLLLMLLLGFGRIDQEVLGFTLIVSMFTSWAGVPLVTLVLRRFSIPQMFL